MNEIVAEAIEEATGSSSKRWALLLVGFVAGVVFAVWVSKRVGSGPGEPDEPEGQQVTGAGNDLE